MSASPLRNTSLRSASEAVNFEHLLQSLDVQCANLPTSVFERFRFELDGIMVDVRRIKDPLGDKFMFSAIVGHLPFSIESPERRGAIRAIVESTRRLPTVRFAIDNAGRITAGGLFDPAPVVAPDFVFYPLTRFLQEARPFMNLIGGYLQESSIFPANI